MRNHKTNKKEIIFVRQHIACLAQVIKMMKSDFFFKKHYNLKHLLSPKGEQNIFSFSVFEENPILLR